MITRKGEMLKFLRKERTYKDIMIEFGGSGHIHAILFQLEHDKLIEKPKRGVYKCVQTGR